MWRLCPAQVTYYLSITVLCSSYNNNIGNASAKLPAKFVTNMALVKLSVFWYVSGETDFSDWDEIWGETSKKNWDPRRDMWNLIAILCLIGLCRPIQYCTLRLSLLPFGLPLVWVRYLTPWCEIQYVYWIVFVITPHTQTVIGAELLMPDLIPYSVGNLSESNHSIYQALSVSAYSYHNTQ